MNDGLGHHDATKPTMYEVENVEGNSEKPYQRVVSACQKDKRDHVHHRKDASPVPQMVQHR